jgi:hypothetical protein
MKVVGGVPALAVSAALAMALTACGSSGSKVSVNTLKQAADKVIAAPASPCPLGIDIDAALKKAGVASTATPGATTATGTLIPAAQAESPSDAGDDSSLEQQDGALITCTYTLSSGGFVETTVVGVQNGSAISVLTTRLSVDGDLGPTVETFERQKFDTGKAVVTPREGRAAVVELGGDGGDVMLEARTIDARGAGYVGPISGEKLRALTEALGKQLHL